MAKVLTETVVVDRQPEAERVREWRFQWLYHSGFSVKNAETLASNTAVDLHLACDAMIHGKARGLDEDFILKLIL